MANTDLVAYKELTTVESQRALAVLLDTVFDDGGVTETSSDVANCVASGRYVLGAWVASELVGGLVAYELPLLRGGAEFFVYDIAVLPSHQKQGIGTGLITALQHEAVRRCINTIFVAAEADDAPAIVFYRSLQAQESPVVHFTITVR